MVRRGLRVWGIVCFVVVSLLLWSATSRAVPLDKDGDIKLGLRTYVNARIGTEDTDSEVLFKSLGANNLVTQERSRTYPFSAAGHLRQNRGFIEAELNHDLDRLRKEGVGPLSLLNNLPFNVKDLEYHLTYRGEFDGLYDWGPREYSSADQYVFCGGRNQIECINPNPATNSPPDAASRARFVNSARRRLRRLGTERQRLFQAYIDMSAGKFFIRFGRQILAWGETDGFRLMDQINPIDSSFGGFLISLDERRVPIDMLRVQYDVGTIGPVTDSFLELYGAIDDKVGYSPGTPAGSPWTLPNLGAPSTTTQTFVLTPHRTFRDIRGGGRFVFNAVDSTFSIAHYYTYFDTPAVQVFVRPAFPVDVANPDNAAFPGGFSAQAVLSPPLVQVSGASATFAVPSFYSVVRSELAYFKGEPRFRQEQLDPFVFHLTQGTTDFLTGTHFNDRINQPTTGGRGQGDSINYVLGADINRFIRAINPNQTLFISTQFFFKHLLGAGERRQVPGRPVLTGEVLPVPARELNVGVGSAKNFGAVEPSFITQPTNQFLHTLFVTTSYMSGQVNPSFLFFYDWGGAFVYQPSVTFVRDPFRFAIDYSILDARSYKGGSGVSLLKDRDNVQFRFEYVI